MVGVKTLPGCTHSCMPLTALVAVMTARLTHPPLLDTGTEYRQMKDAKQTTDAVTVPIPEDRLNAKIYYRSRMKLYPGGGKEIMYARKPTFTPGDTAEQKPKKKTNACGFRHTEAAKDESKSTADAAASFDRSRRRARAKVRDLALSNQFDYFITLTLDPKLVDRHDISSFKTILKNWLDNNVRRRGLRYILVPERHKDGAIHFHGLINDCLTLQDSGHHDTTGHKIWNITDWKLGFSTAIQLYGNYAQAVSYVCKYIGKQGEKVDGRWYYSGGGLQMPRVVYGCMEDWETAVQLADAASADGEAAASYRFKINETGNEIGIIRQNM